tara:strand:- start:131 stop:352 length:222 start_codon:yes stop_codon:yes gene_type:complete
MEFGRNLFFAGSIIAFMGLIIYFFGDKFSWFGNLFGDFKYESKNMKFYAPITSMLLLSVVLSFVINILIKIFK